jgi:hypothetical protein
MGIIDIFHIRYIATGSKIDGSDGLTCSCLGGNKNHLIRADPNHVACVRGDAVNCDANA